MYCVEFVICDEGFSNPIIKVKDLKKFLEIINHIEQMSFENLVLFSGFCINLSHVSYLMYTLENGELLNIIRNKENRPIDIELDSERIKREKEEFEKAKKIKKEKLVNIVSLEDYDNLV